MMFMELCLSVGLLACVSCRPGCSWSSAYLLVCWHVCPVDHDVHGALFICWFVGMYVLLTMMFMELCLSVGLLACVSCRP